MSGASLCTDIVRILQEILCGKQHPTAGQQQQYGEYSNQSQSQNPPQPQPQIQQQLYPLQQQQQQQQQTWSQVASHQNGFSSNGKYPTQHQNGQYPSQQQNGQYPSHQQNGQYPSYGRPHGIPPGGVVGPHHPHYQNQDLINATNQRYTHLRDEARHEGDEAHKFFAQSHQVYQNGDGARAHELSEQGKAHERRHDELNNEASGWIFNENNIQSPPGTVDLHGLYVKEAIERTEAAISQSQSSGQTELRVITGKGIHSPGHVASIKPAVEEMMQKYNSPRISTRKTRVSSSLTSLARADRHGHGMREGSWVRWGDNRVGTA